MVNEPPRTREDLMRIIAKALQRSITYLSDDDTRAAADTILRELKFNRVRMSVRRNDHD